jgi:cellulose synthase/poly-beta-1,6-N-acetylglucosamine synthase-like glycosyltransferase
MKNRAFIRFCEIIPGALVWATLIGSVVLSYLYPIAVIAFIIIFDVYWLLRISYFIPFLIVSWARFRRDSARDWQRDAERLPGYGRIRHLIMLPTWKEDIYVLRDAFENLLRSATPSDRMIVCLGGEERDRERFEEYRAVIQKEYGHRFLKVVTTLHPDPRGKPDEIQGKGSNMNWMGRQMMPIIESLGIRQEDLIVSAFDIDTVTHPQYFACVTHKYLTVPDPTRSSYQPVALYNNNLWDAKAPVRVAMFGTTFWLMSELARPERMMTFSSHSMSWRMLLDVGFWQKDIVSEDSRIFLQALSHYHGDYRVTPIYLPISMDSVDSVGYAGSLKALYKQMRRWAWGVENFPYMADRFRKDGKMPLRLKAAFLWKQIEGMYTWATAPMLITVLGQLPFWLASGNSRTFAIFQNTPFTLQRLMQLALIGVFVSAALALTLLPKRPSRVPRRSAIIVMFLQWILLPVTFVLFGSIPAIDAQTRHMLGGRFRLGFNVTAKTRRGS